MNRRHYFSHTPWEPLVGYCRAVRVGNRIIVSGTTATDEQGEIVGKGDAFQQTRQIIQNIQRALQALGGDLSDVVRTRIYVTNINLWEEVGRAHGEFFQKITLATSMVEVSRLIHPDMLVEMEAEAIVNE